MRDICSRVKLSYHCCLLEAFHINLEVIQLLSNLLHHYILRLAEGKQDGFSTKTEIFYYSVALNRTDQTNT